MAVAPVLAVVKLNKKSGIPADAVENTFTFLYDTTGIGASALFDAIDHFYNYNVGGTGTLMSLLSESLLNGSLVHEISFYNLTGHLDGSPHGSPIATVPMDGATLGTGTPLPDEIAACLSFRADYASDVEFGVGTRPRARDRGRVYIGPLEGTATLEDTVTHEPSITAATRQIIVDAGAYLRDQDVGWSVWSRTDAALKLVTDVWCDNAFDVQRRRGNKPTLRTTA